MQEAYLLGTAEEGEKCMAEKKKPAGGAMRLDRLLGEMGIGTRSQIRKMAGKGLIQGQRTDDKDSGHKSGPPQGFHPGGRAVPSGMCRMNIIC